MFQAGISALVETDVSSLFIAEWLLVALYPPCWHGSGTIPVRNSKAVKGDPHAAETIHRSKNYLGKYCIFGTTENRNYFSSCDNVFGI